MYRLMQNEQKFESVPWLMKVIVHVTEKHTEPIRVSVYKSIGESKEVYTFNEP